MKRFKTLIVLAVVTLLLAACAGPAGPAGPEGPQGPPGPEGPAGMAGEGGTADMSCSACHNDTDIITGKQYAWEESTHGSGEAFVRGSSASCAGCHSGTAFQAMAAAGQTPGDVEAGDAEPTRQDCRACHQIHTTYSGADWALTTTDPVVMYAFEGVTYDGGTGNLCANCHQPRRQMEAADGVVNVSSTHWGPHHGPQTTVLLGVGGVGAEGSASGHYSMVENTCVSCHLPGHNFEPNLAACTECHADAEDFDINGVQSEVEALLEELEGYLLEAGLWSEEGHPVVGEYPEDQAGALWNYILIAVEDSSLGVHNPGYVIDLLEYSISVFE